VNFATAVSDRLVYMTKEEAKERSEITRNDDTDPAKKKSQKRRDSLICGQSGV
jgi:hypothetical protein